MKIKWIRKYDGKNLPIVDVEVGAKELPEVTSKSAIILIPIVLLFACCVYIKKTYLGGVAFSRVDWMIGLKISSFSFVLILCLYDFNTHYCNRIEKQTWKSPRLFYTYLSELL